MQRTPVESKSLHSVGYDAASRVLEIEFVSGRVYCYVDVPSQIYEWLMRTKGKGGYFNRMIREQFSMRDVTPGDGDADLEQRLRRSLDDDA